MAAGASERMAQPKQLLPYQGESLLRHAARVAIASRCDRVFVVLGSSIERMRPELSGLPVEIVENPRWAEGMGASIRVGAQAARDADMDCLILALADQPLITPAILNGLLAAHHASGLPIVASQYSETVGVPALFAREFFDSLLALEPDRGCKDIIIRNASKAMRLPCPEAAVDVDTPAQYRGLSE